MEITKRCPICGYEEKMYKNPFPTVDIIIKAKEKNKFKGIVLIYRKNDPIMWALPGGFVDYGETVEEAALREAYEETNLKVYNLKQFHVYSDPKRDPRKHTLSVVFIGEAEGIPKPSDDAAEAKIFNKNEIPEKLAFDHKKIVHDFFKLENL